MKHNKWVKIVLFSFVLFLFFSVVSTIHGFTHLNRLFLPDYYNSFVVDDNGALTLKVLSGKLPEEITIPASLDGKAITTIGLGAFNRCETIKKVVLDDNITKIEGTGFCYCFNLESINLGNSLTSIGGWAFADCYKLSSIKLPEP